MSYYLAIIGSYSTSKKDHHPFRFWQRFDSIDFIVQTVIRQSFYSRYLLKVDTTIVCWYRRINKESSNSKPTVQSSINHVTFANDGANNKSPSVFGDVIFRKLPIIFQTPYQILQPRIQYTTSVNSCLRRKISCWILKKLNIHMLSKASPLINYYQQPYISGYSYRQIFSQSAFLL
jgi:hypothetical protein